MTSTKSKSVWQAARRIALVSFVAVAGCENSTDANNSPEGSYAATSLLTTTNGQTTNHIANGSTITLTLLPFGLTAGQMHIEAAPGTPETDADLAGTWTLNGSIVGLDHLDDTFLRDVDLTFNGNTLAGDQVIAGTRIQITLRR